jgi:hypothetical protein
MIDHPGKFYLGTEYDPGAPQHTSEPYMLSTRDLLSGAACLGTAGKASLGVCILEEALLQNIPALIVDPSGDLAASLSAGCEPDMAAPESMDESRALALADRAVFQVYTPGAAGGLPVNVWQSLNPPPPSSGLNWTHHANALRARIAQVVSALLALAGIESGAEQGREHVLLATIFESAWRAGLSLDISLLIRMIQDPPVSRIGTFDMNVFYPKPERAALALALNTLAAAPSIDAWQKGVALDIATLLKPLRDGHTGVGGSNPVGKTRANIFSLARLTTAERKFFLTTLLSELIMWMNTQTGTSVLRCLVYFDAVGDLWAAFPGDPLLTELVKTVIEQGPTAGVGLLLAAQNPVDLDYAGLAGLGTWFIAELSSLAGRSFVLEGLQSAGSRLDREDAERLLSSLPARVFLALGAAGALRIFRVRPSILGH